MPSSKTTSSKDAAKDFQASMRQPLKTEQKKKVNKSTRHLVRKNPSTRQLLAMVREFACGAHQKVADWFDTKRDTWIAELSAKEKAGLLEEYRVANLSDEEKTGLLEEYRASANISVDDYNDEVDLLAAIVSAVNHDDDEADLLAIAATKISKGAIAEKVTECFGAPPGSNTPANAVFTLHDPREEKAAENELVTGFVAFPSPNTDARSELEVFGADSYAVAVISVCGADGKNLYKHLMLGKPRTYRAAARVTGRISLSKSGASIAITLLMLYGEYIGIPKIYHILDDTTDDDGKLLMTRPEKICDIAIHGPSVILTLVEHLSVEDVEEICAYEIRDLVGADAKPAAVTAFRAAMRRAYQKAVENNEICGDSNVKGSTSEEPLPENCNLWQLVSSPAMILLLPTCIWAYNCQAAHTSLVEPISIEDIRSAVNRAYKRAEKNSDSSAPMVDDKDKDKGKGKSKSKGKGEVKKATMEIGSVDLQVIEDLRDNMRKSLKYNFTSAALRSLREKKGLPSKKDQEAYKSADEADASTLVLNSALCLEGLTPQERGYYMAMLKKAKSKLEQQDRTARDRAKIDPVMAAMYKELKPNEVGSTETSTVSVRSITQALITSGMQTGQLARQHARVQNEKQGKSALAIIDSFEDILNSANAKIDKANKAISSLEQSEQHLASELAAKDKEIGALRTAPEKLKAELVKAKCTSIAAAEDAKQAKTKLSSARAEIDDLEKKVASLAAKNKELEKKAAQKAPALAPMQDDDEEKGELAAFLMDEKDLNPKKKRDQAKCAAEAGGDEESGDTDDEDDASSAVFGTKAAKKKSTASVLAQMGNDGDAESEAESEEEAEEEPEEEDELTAEDLSRDGAGESAARGTKRLRDEDESPSEESGAKQQKTKGGATDAVAPVEDTKKKEESLDSW